MNKPTPGPWMINSKAIAWQRDDRGRLYWDFPIQIGTLGTCVRAETAEEAEANAALIVAAVNACFAINPSNPLAVAEALPELVKACRGLTSQSKEVSEEEGKSINDWDIAYDLDPLRAALAKLEAK